MKTDELLHSVVDIVELIYHGAVRMPSLAAVSKKRDQKSFSNIEGVNEQR